jgi:hypothetical protein
MDRSDVLGLAVLAAGVIGAVVLIVAELSTIAQVDVGSTSCEVINDSDPALADRCALSGLERHGGALILVALLAIAMAAGAGPGGSRPAAVALLAIGAVVLGVALLVDLPETGRTGAIGDSFEAAKASAGTGFTLEIAAALLLGAAGSLRLLRDPG